MPAPISTTIPVNDMPARRRIPSFPSPKSIDSILVKDASCNISLPEEPVIWSVPSPPSMISFLFTAPLNVKISSPPIPLNVSAAVSTLIRISSAWFVPITVSPPVLSVMYSRPRRSAPNV